MSMSALALVCDITIGFDVIAAASMQVLRIISPIGLCHPLTGFGGASAWGPGGGSGIPVGAPSVQFLACGARQRECAGSGRWVRDRRA